MLFNSYIFIFVFLPIVLAGYFLLGKSRHSRGAIVWLMVASLFFYGYWNPLYLPLLVGSIFFNYILSGLLLRWRTDRHTWARGVFWLGIIANLSLLVYYKYTDFFINSINHFFNSSIPLLNVILPLGISFFTITQILALIDCYEGVVKKHNFIDYALFVSFFPHLMAGPILYHRPMMKQFQDRSLRIFNLNNFTLGLVLFILGLAKKLLIADSFIGSVEWGYSQANDLHFFAAWFTVVCYALELYFDFSGYSDMAVGIARMMNIQIPINFNRPFHATSVTNFWQRWHISLTNTITACVYMPLVRTFAKKRNGLPTFGQSLAAAAIAFFLVGIWHGAGGTFVVFAFLQSIGIACSMLWKKYGKPLPSYLSHSITLLFVAISFAIFRAPDLSHAWSMCKGMIGLHGFDIPQPILSSLGSMRGFCSFPTLSLPADAPLMTLYLALLLIAISPDANGIVRRIEKKASLIYAPILGALFIGSILALTQESLFLYFQF